MGFIFGDDCIAVKSGVEDNPNKVACENITITNCTMVHGHGGVVIVVNLVLLSSVQVNNNLTPCSIIFKMHVFT